MGVWRKCWRLCRVSKSWRNGNRGSQMKSAWSKAQEAINEMVACDIR